MTVIARFSNQDGDGRVYPDSCEVRMISGSQYQVVDVTGWNGYEQCGDQLIATFYYEQDAMQYAQLRYERWSNPLEVIDAAAALLNKEPDAFKKLKAAVDWRDRR